MKLMKKIVPAVLIILLLTGCSGAGRNERYFTDPDKLHVVSTLFVGYDFARQIGGDNAEVMLLLKPGSESHSFEPTPADIIAIEKCDVFICTGGENDAWVDEILEAIDNPDIRIIRMTECVDGLYEEEDVEGMQGEGGYFTGEEEFEDEEVEWDEHVWMDIDNAEKICEEIADTFSELKPELTARINERLKKYTAELTEVDELLFETVLNAPRDELIFADRFPARYFVERYGLKYYAAFPGCSENTEASAATVSFLINKAREDKVPCVMKIELSAGKLAAVVSEETGAEIGTFYTGHNVSADEFDSGITFTEMMKRNAELLSRALY